MENLTAYLESSRTAAHFGIELDEIITRLRFDPPEFYPIFQAAFEAAYKKFGLHIPNHSAHSLFCVAHIFDPKYMHIGNTQRHSIYVINEFNNPSNNLVHEWGIYCGLEFDGSVDESKLDVY